ncbi:aminotransferase class IV [Pseudoroseicyclus aestuarii]|uniref:Probable branched-chain-amino-acid aminotransferase n=1 Tax=Pseudoroseicyclus aestuarii TaxID=1795041 RepID=A0A318SUV2_9RHOB|nr:aminotransferase class IV [Pseudoroseicyclus aestuarii]PYE84109.1 4-amino-4-deoxychorismate lyase [Pseudoroseicyclus aestuarii]
MTGAEAGQAPRILETMGWRPGEGVRHAPLHLARLERTARQLGYPLASGVAEGLLAQVEGPHPLRLRLTLDVVGGLRLERFAMPAPVAAWRLRLAEERLDPGDPWLRIKTTRRALYDAARAALPEGVDEALFLNTRGELCEGAISTLFVETAAGAFLTPALGAGLLPGVLREALLGQGWREAVLRPDDLASARRIWMGNALRGLIPARLA